MDTNQEDITEHRKIMLRAAGKVPDRSWANFLIPRRLVVPVCHRLHRCEESGNRFEEYV